MNITKTKNSYLLISLFGVLSMTLSGVVMAVGEGSYGQYSSSRGGEGSFTAAGANGDIGAAGEGGGGGGGGITGGAGGAGGGGISGIPGSGGAGGAIAGADGSPGTDGTPGTDSGGGGGGGGAAGLTVSSDYTNSSSTTGGKGGAGGAGGGNGILGGFGGGGGGGGNGIIVNGSVVLTNTGTITGGNGGAGGSSYGVAANDGSPGSGLVLLNDASVINHGTISSSAVSITVDSSSNASSITNSGTGIISSPNKAIYNFGTNTIISNSGLIAGESYVIHNFGFATITSISNYGTISANYNFAIFNEHTITNFTNFADGRISTQSAAISNNDTINTFINHGEITSLSGWTAIQNNNSKTIGTLTNTGTISAPSGFGIYNAPFSPGDDNNPEMAEAIISTLNNLQGSVNAAGALTYSGQLPINYNIIINSPTLYGQLAVTNGSGPTNFGVYAGSSIIAGRAYAGVLSGIGLNSSYSTGYLTAFTGAYGRFNWTLAPQLTCTDNCIFDLTFVTAGPPPEDTQDSLNKSALELRGAYVLQSAAINYNLNNDCNLFDKHGICTSVTGSQTYVGGGLGNDRTNGTLTVAYRVNDKIRIGGYLDQTLNIRNSSNVHLSNGSPAFGAFAVWNANADGLGLQVRASAGYADRDMTVTRQVIGFSEPGTGKTGLDTFGAALVGSYAMAMNNNITLSPYAGIRYTKINADAYTETGSDSVTAPLTYSALTQKLTTAMLGTKVSKSLGERTVAYGSIGLEQDLNHNDGTYVATGLDGLTPIAFNGNANRTSATASVGAYYNIGERQRIAANLVWSEQSFTSINATSLMATYTHGF